MRKKPAIHFSGKSSLRTLRLFLFIVFLFIIISLAAKLFFAIQASKFAGGYRFTVGVLDTHHHLVEVLSYDPTDKSGVFMTVTGREDNLTPEQALGIAFDGTITGQRGSLGNMSPQTLFMDSLLHRTHLKTTIAPVDLIRLWLFSGSLSGTSNIIKSLQLPLDTIQIDKLTSSLFADPILTKENVSVQILNGTTELGLGKRLERMLTNMGANVVLVSTSQTEIGQTRLIYYGRETDSVRRIGQILHLTPEKGKNKTIAEIVIMLGDSSRSTGEF